MMDDRSRAGQPAEGGDAREGRVWIDRAVGGMSPSPYAYGVVGLCGLIAMAEGYDAQAMAFAAPLIAAQWGLSSGAMGVLLAASIIAMVAGGFLLSPLGDRLGRRPAILAALAVVATATAAGALAPDYNSLLVSRLIAGLALGLAFPTVIALAMEMMPHRLHALSVVIVSCGYPVGGAVGGAVSSLLIEDHGAQAIFLLGGGTTAILLLICAFFLPESPLWMAARGRPVERIFKLVSRLGATLPLNAASYSVGEGKAERSPVAALFTPERRTRTLLLWLMNFANLAMVYYFVIWTPTILVNSGRSAASAAAALALLSGAGVVGGIAFAFALRKWGMARTLAAAYTGAVVLIAALATTSPDSAEFTLVLAASGAFIVGSQFCLNAVVNQYYPTSIRATAAGFASGAGRAGAVAAPLIGAIVVTSENSYSFAIMAGCVPAVLALMTLVALVLVAPIQDTGPVPGGIP